MPVSNFKFSHRAVLMGGISALAFTTMVATQNPAAAQEVLDDNSTWPTLDTASGDVTASAGDDVDIVTFTLTDTGNDNTAIGAVTGTTGTLAITGADGENNQTIESVDLSGAGAVTVTIDAPHNAVDVTIDNDFMNGGTLDLTNSSTTEGVDLNMTVNGDTTVTGTTTITADGGENGEANLILNGETNTFTDVVTVNGGAGDVEFAGIAVSGGTVNFDGGLIFNDDPADDAEGNAYLFVGGTEDQIINGVINGTATDPNPEGEGAIVVRNGDATATFNNVVGTTNGLNFLGVGPTSEESRTRGGGNAVFTADTVINTIRINGSDTVDEDANATFSADLTADNIRLNDAIGDATIIFDGAAAQAIAGTINGAASGEGTIRVLNDSTVIATFADEIGTNEDGVVGAIEIGGTNSNDDVVGGSANFEANVVVDALRAGSV